MQLEATLLAAFAALAVAAPVEGNDASVKRDIVGPPSPQAGASNLVKDIQLAAQDLAKLSTVVSSNGGNDNAYDFVSLAVEGRISSQDALKCILTTGD